MGRTSRGFGEIIGRSAPMRRVYRQIGKAAAFDIPVLITGETGTGKDLIAKEIHQAGSRANKLFNPVNTGAIPPDLISSTLFGHEKGAFTGAASRKAGMFELSDGGTLFLDEIGTMDEQTQVSLLRVLEDGMIRRVGGTEFFKVDVRLVAATNANLIAAVDAGEFRQDLYYRLNVYTIDVPPLRKRNADIMLLAEYFLKRYAEEFEKPIEIIDSEARALLTDYLWPGNVRELENVIIQAVVSADGDAITADLLKPAVREPEEVADVSVRVGMTLEDAERALIEQTLARVDGKRSEAARILGISRKGFYNKLKRYGL